MRNKLTFFLISALMFISFDNQGQETVFSMLKSDLKLADGYFTNKRYYQALDLYQNYLNETRSSEVYLRIAHCYFYLKQYTQSLVAYDDYMRAHQSLPAKENYWYAEALSACGKYDQAVEYYGMYLKTFPDDQLAIKKLWRIANINYLYEDSLHFAVRPVGFNTSDGEMCPVIFQKGLMFMSNRKHVQIIEKIDGAVNSFFYSIYHSPSIHDSTGVVQLGKPFIVGKELPSKFHVGPVCLYENGSKMIFAANSNSGGDKVMRTLNLFFAELTDGAWSVTGAFPYNNSEYSVSDPAISSDGQSLYFSSDMEGGFGGRDLYFSELVDGKWSRPENLGENINTAYDEVFPYLHQGKTLYFSSNGQAGMGGLDIFKSEVNAQGFQEPQNAGYPLNSHGDDFGIVVDSLHTRGYFSSNRRNGGFDDDIYEFDMDLQIYPVQISGQIRYKEHSWSDSSELHVLPNARLFLIDNDRNVLVHESVSDDSGHFSILIPYFSKYKIRVVGEGKDEHIVSLEIPKHRKYYSSYEIVIVKDVFRNAANQIVK